MSAAAPLPPDEEYRRFCDFFHARTGIHLREGKRYFVDRRVAERMEQTPIGSLRAYTLKLRFDDAGGTELQNLINAFTVNETYFYREDYQLRDAVVGDDAGTRPAARRGAAAHWSLPCSTGEEPYPIALRLTANWPGLDRVDVEIVGFDIDTGVLARARAGLYDARGASCPARAARAALHA